MSWLQKEHWQLRSQAAAHFEGAGEIFFRGREMAASRGQLAIAKSSGGPFPGVEIGNVLVNCDSERGEYGFGVGRREFMSDLGA